jgi:hypothetical protein
MRVICVTTLYLLTALVATSQEPVQCRCGTPLSSGLRYSSVPTDGMFAEPSVAKISMENNQEVIWVSYNSRTPNGDLQEQAAISHDGGVTWKLNPEYRNTGFAAPGSKSIPYQHSDENDLLRKSSDGGNRWIDCKINVDGVSAPEFVRKVTNGKRGALHFGFSAIDPRNPRTIYGFLSVWVPSVSDPDVQETTYNLPGIYVSHDAGDTWAMFASNLRGGDPDEPPKLGIDPSDTARMLAHGASGVVMTTDGGRSWKPVGEQAALEAPAEIQGRREAIEAKGASGMSIPLYPRFSYLAVYEFDFDPANGNVIYLVTNKGLYKSEDAARTWCLVYSGTPALSEVHSLVFDPTDSKRLYLGTRSRVLVSDDAGCHFRVLFDWDRFTREMNK